MSLCVARLIECNLALLAGASTTSLVLATSMAATKLNPYAPPFHRSCSLHLSPPAPPAVMLPYHGGACPPGSPAGAIYFCAQAQFPVPSPHHHPFFQFPVQHPAGIPCKTGPTTTAKFFRMGAKPARVFRKGVVPAKPALAPLKRSPAQFTEFSCNVVPAQPEHVLPEDVGEPAPHGLPPRKLMISGAAKKQQKAATCTDLGIGCKKELAGPDATVAAADQKPEARQKAGKRRNKKHHDGAVGGPRLQRARPGAWTWTPSSTFTTPRTGKPPKELPMGLGSCTTVMLRNIPNKLRGVEIMALLDEHCARANRAAGAVVSAYDVVYLPMDFRRRGNFGYAFINFTTADAAVGLYYSLQRCGWKACGTRKTIDIVPAKIQGKEALVRHLSRHKFECETDEYLPAVFSPPRDGGVLATATTTTRVGQIVLPPPPRRLAPPPWYVKKSYDAPVVPCKVQG